MKRILIILLLMTFSFTIFAQTSSLEQKLVNALLYVDSRTFEENQKANNYIVEQFRKGNYVGVAKQAKSYLQSRKRMIEQMYFAMSEQERADITILIEKDLVFHYILSTAVHTKDERIVGEIYDYMLFIKQLQLRTSQQISRAIQKSNNRQLIELYEGYRSIQKQLAISNPPSSQDNEILKSLYDRAGKVLAQQGSKYLKMDDVSWRDIQNRLSDFDAAIVFVRFNLFDRETITDLRMYAAIVVTKGAPNPVIIPMTTEKNLTRWMNGEQGDLYDVNKYGNALSQLVWLKILTYIDQQKLTSIFFSPIGVLNNLAIETLPYSRDETTNAHYTVTRMSTTREIMTKHDLLPKKTAILYGDLFYRASMETMQQSAVTRSAVYPLLYSKQEIEGISAQLSKQQYQVMTLSQKQGTEASFKSLDGKSPSILHLSTHGFVNRNAKDVMQQSGLVLSFGARAWEGKSIPENTEDGILTAAEIAALDLSSTNIVVLSACNTALGEITSEGVWGLQRAFKQAGVQTIVMSLWQVDDEATSVFMQYLYEALLKYRQTMETTVTIDRQIAEDVALYFQLSLTEAQQRMRQHPKYYAPYYWAGFIVID